MLYQGNGRKVSVVRRAGWRPVRILGFPVKYCGAVRQMRDLTTPLVTAVTGTPKDLELLAESNCPPKGRLGKKRRGDKGEGRGGMGRKRLRRNPPVDLAIAPILVSDDSEDEEVQDGGDGDVSFGVRGAKESEKKKDRALAIAPKRPSQNVDGGKGGEGRERSRLAAREATKVREWRGDEEEDDGEDEEDDEESGRREMAIFVGREGEPINKRQMVRKPTMIGWREGQVTDAAVRGADFGVVTGKEKPKEVGKECDKGAQDVCVYGDVNATSIEIATFKALPRELEAKQEEVIRVATRHAFERAGLEEEGLRGEDAQRNEDRSAMESPKVERRAESEPAVRDRAVAAGSTITVKVELKEDLRRLRIDSRWSFKMLWEELRALFGIETSFRIRYRDEEKDYVTVASDKDMIELFTIVSEHSLVPLRMKVVL